MNPAHAMEYVAQYIVKHNEYRDNEIVQLNKRIQQLEDRLNVAETTLKELDTVKCTSCQAYVNNIDRCEMCETEKCQTCSDIQHIESWNRSGMNMCFICRNMYCNFCLDKTVLDVDGYCVECADAEK